MVDRDNASFEELEPSPQTFDGLIAAHQQSLADMARTNEAFSNSDEVEQVEANVFKKIRQKVAHSQLFLDKVSFDVAWARYAAAEEIAHGERPEYPLAGLEKSPLIPEAKLPPAFGECIHGIEVARQRVLPQLAALQAAQPDINQAVLACVQNAVPEDLATLPPLEVARAGLQFLLTQDYVDGATGFAIVTTALDDLKKTSLTSLLPAFLQTVQENPEQWVEESILLAFTEVTGDFSDPAAVREHIIGKWALIHTLLQKGAESYKKAYIREIEEAVNAKLHADIEVTEGRDFALLTAEELQLRADMLLEQHKEVLRPKASKPKRVKHRGRVTIPNDSTTSIIEPAAPETSKPELRPVYRLRQAPDEGYVIKEADETTAHQAVANLITDYCSDYPSEPQLKESLWEAIDSLRQQSDRSGRQRGIGNLPERITIGGNSHMVLNAEPSRMGLGKGSSILKRTSINFVALDKGIGIVRIKQD